MNYKTLHTFVCFFIACTFGACGNEEEIMVPAAKDVTLCFTISTPAVSTGTRAASDVSNHPDAPENWSDEDRLIDGRYLKRLTLLLTSGNTLVGLKDVSYANTSTTEESATFKGLTAGNSYRLIAIANYDALTDFPNITNLTVGNNISQILTSLYNYKLDAGDDYVAPRQEQPLTLVQDFTMPAAGGTHTVSGELIRTYARLRIELENKSELNELTINDLLFNTIFAQKQAYLLTDPDNPDRNFSGITTGMPTLNSTDALTVYTTKKKIAAKSSDVLFDGYILESRNDDTGYKYTLNVEYKGASYTTTTQTIKSTGTCYTETSQLRDYYDTNTMFLIKNTRRDNYIMVNESGKVYQQGVDLNTNLLNDQHLLWKLERYSDSNKDYYYLYNVGKQVYIGDPPGTQNAFPTTGKNTYFRFTDYSNSTYGGIQMDAYGAGGYNYMNDYSGNFICSYSAPDAGNGFHFYPVEEKTETENHYASYSTPITLRTIDAVSGVASKATQISRNDFINVLVNVAYNENTGTMEFYVKDWTKVNSDITFD